MKRKYIEPVLNIVRFEENGFFLENSSGEGQGDDPKVKEAAASINYSMHGDFMLEEPGAGDIPANGTLSGNNPGDSGANSSTDDSLSSGTEAGPENSVPSVGDMESADSGAPTETVAPEPIPEPTIEAAPESAPVDPEPPAIDPPASEEPSVGIE